MSKGSRWLVDAFSRWLRDVKKINGFCFGITLICGAISPIAIGQPDLVVPSAIRPGDEVIFFHTTAWLDERDQRWHIPIHAWVYRPSRNVARKSALEKELYTTYGLEVTDYETRTIFDERVGFLLADNERSRRLSIRIAGHGHSMPPTQSNGQVFEVLSLPASELTSELEAGFITYRLVLPAGDNREIVGATQFIAPRGYSVISDIEDTVKLSFVTDTRRFIDATIFRAFEPVVAMAPRYFAWWQQGATIHFVSSTPWQFYPILNSFFTANGFPFSTINLNNERRQNPSALDLLERDEEAKAVHIERLFRLYPYRTFVLIGDSSERDPEIYAGLMRSFPNQVQHVFIRNVSNADTSEDARFAQVFEGVDRRRWTIFDRSSTPDFVVPKLFGEEG